MARSPTNPHSAVPWQTATVGDVVEVDAPSGKLRFTILTIE